jgi:hypothetical protein
MNVHINPPYFFIQAAVSLPLCDSKVVPSHQIKKAEHTEVIILRQLGHLIIRPAAFCPLLTKGLALSGNLISY